MHRPKFLTYLTYEDETNTYDRKMIFYLFGWKIYISIGHANKYELDYAYKRGTWKRRDK